jgi:hypothetical protein
MAEATPTLTRDEIAVVLSREEARATIEGLQVADAQPIPLRDSRHGAIGKIQQALADLDKPPEPPPEGAAYAAKGATRDDTRAPLHAKDKPHG